VKKKKTNEEEAEEMTRRERLTLFLIGVYMD
jgi:hypothetical protein